MQNIIHLLPDAIANQIAAGEVVQRPASVLKELLENAVDAGATRIDVVIKDAGKTLIQVTDNGSGMSAADARMAFERHATSKIRNQDDLYGIHTLGFRGEALASIAAVAQVNLRTRLHEAEVGTQLEIAASQVNSQEACVSPPGTTFQVKNLFFNVPARRNFLKTNPIETRHLMNEFMRVALAYPEVAMSLFHNDTQVYDLAPHRLEQRIVAIFGQEYEGKLIQIEESTGYAHFTGFIGSPEVYKKSRGDQYFIVNGRFIKSPYLHHAIASAYEEFIPKDHHPFYVVGIGIEPTHIDINIHPTKTEVKFDDERTLYVLLQGAIKRGLSLYHQSPMMDLPTSDTTDPETMRAIYQRPTPNPNGKSIAKPQGLPQKPRLDVAHWDALYRPPAPTEKPAEVQTPALFDREKQSSFETVEAESFLIQFQSRYLLTERQGKLLIIDQHLAHQRILYERFLRTREQGNLPSQQLLFPQTIELSASDYQAIRQVDDIMVQMGFEIKEFGPNTLIIYGTPAGVGTAKINDIFEQILVDIRHTDTTRIQQKVFEDIARVVAMRCAISSQQQLSPVEMKNIKEELFRCQAPAFSPNNKPTYRELSPVDLEAYFR